MKKEYVCSICGNDYNDLDVYLKCVSTCGAKLKKEQEEAKKRAEELNAALNRVKQAKTYYEQQLKDFKERYPEEYKLNFSDNNCKGTCSGTCSCGNNDDLNKNQKEPLEYLTFTYTDDGKGNPKMSASINGEKVDSNTISNLFNDPEMNHIAKMLGL